MVNKNKYYIEFDFIPKEQELPIKGKIPMQNWFDLSHERMMVHLNVIVAAQVRVNGEGSHKIVVEYEEKEEC